MVIRGVFSSQPPWTSTQCSLCWGAQRFALCLMPVGSASRAELPCIALQHP